jgi:pimeloyl-ACP methyl ester carboxylesterase
MKHDIEFTAEDQTVLRGAPHTPETPGSAPGTVMAHGFSGMKEQLDHYAALFAASGFSVLLYDYRSFGGSDGLPRYAVNPYQQIRDWQDVITFALTQPEFDDSVAVGVPRIHKRATRLLRIASGSRCRLPQRSRGRWNMAQHGHTSLAGVLGGLRTCGMGAVRGTYAAVDGGRRA